MGKLKLRDLFLLSSKMRFIMALRKPRSKKVSEASASPLKSSATSSTEDGTQGTKDVSGFARTREKNTSLTDVNTGVSKNPLKHFVKRNESVVRIKSGTPKYSSVSKEQSNRFSSKSQKRKDVNLASTTEKSIKVTTPSKELELNSASLPILKVPNV